MLRFSQLEPRGDSKEKKEYDYYICADPYGDDDSVSAIAVFSVLDQRVVSTSKSTKKSFVQLVEMYKKWYKNSKVVKDINHARQII